MALHRDRHEERPAALGELGRPRGGQHAPAEHLDLEVARQVRGDAEAPAAADDVHHEPQAAGDVERRRAACQAGGVLPVAVAAEPGHGILEVERGDRRVRVDPDPVDRHRQAHVRPVVEERQHDATPGRHRVTRMVGVEHLQRPGVPRPPQQRRAVCGLHHVRLGERRDLGRPRRVADEQLHREDRRVALRPTTPPRPLDPGPHRPQVDRARQRPVEPRRRVQPSDGPERRQRWELLGRRELLQG
ncbi:MAG: hypothetical protein M0P31_06465 [Solirubrobacteraceae bacterium]|nr:hypothetical protein [Solirubrobacteraceae bacterium]